MIRSMTGFGEAELDTAAGRLRLEIKTVNHRFLNANVKTPTGFDRFEKSLTDVLKRYFARGHVSVYLSVDRAESEVEHLPTIDLDRARAYADALEALGEELGLPGRPDVALVARFHDVFRAPDRDHAVEVEAEAIGEVADAAARACRDMREQEGVALRQDLIERLEAIGAALDRAQERAPQRLVEHRDRLREAVRDLTEQVDVDEDRLAREIAYLAERWDVNEEIVRFRSHLVLFGQALDGPGDEPVGKRLGFLVQEMLREANTLGSKANDSDLAQLAVGIKEDIERIREQVENVE